MAAALPAFVQLLARASDCSRLGPLLRDELPDGHRLDRPIAEFLVGSNVRLQLALAEFEFIFDRFACRLTSLRLYTHQRHTVTNR